MTRTVLLTTHIARAALEEADRYGFAHGFLERALPASLPAVPVNRTIRTPSNLTDLRVRKSSDAGFFFSLNSALSARLRQMVDKLSESQATLGRQLAEVIKEDRTGQQVSAVLDAIADFIGDLNLALNLVSTALASGYQPASIGTATRMATILAIGNDRRGIRLFADILRDDLQDAATLHLTGIRCAAALVKRFGEIEAADSVLDNVGASSRRAHDGSEISGADLWFLEALTSNLRAFLRVKQGRLDEAYAIICDATQFDDTSGLVMVPAGMAERCRAEIRVNRIQLLWELARRDEAIERCAENVEESASRHPDSLSKALSVAGYYAFRHGDCETALRMLRRAEELLLSEASPKRLAQCRKSAAGCYLRLGLASQRQAVLSGIERDALGLAGPLIDS